MGEDKPKFGPRSEVTFDSGEGTVGLLYTNRALAEVETQTGKSVWMMVEVFGKGFYPPIVDLVVLLKAGMEAYRREHDPYSTQVSTDDAYRVLDLVGYSFAVTQVMPAVGEVLFFTREKKQ